jgi:hypothetical protein
VTASARPTILFGAFDRHNLGDMLFAHVLAALLQPRPLFFAGLVDADLRACGGHRVHALSRLVHRLPGANLIHAGGEILDCDAWLAAAMLLPPAQAHAVIARFDAHPLQRLDWAQQCLGMADLAPYVAGRARISEGGALMHNAVGGAALATADEALRDEVLAKLAEADLVTVRDAKTAAALEAGGVASRLLPDSVCMLKELFGQNIARRVDAAPVAKVRAHFPAGYLAVQFSADFGDDHTLLRIAAGLDALARDRRLGIVFFRAGAALWHDDIDMLRRCAAFMHAPSMVFDSIDIWDICALIAACRGYLGSSLHGRIVAMAFGLPRLTLLHPQAQPAKQLAYAAAWETPLAPAAAVPDAILAHMQAALDVAPAALHALAHEHAQLYQQDFTALRAMLR